MANWLLNQTTPLSYAQEFDAAASEGAFTLNQTTPLGMAQTFATGASEWTAEYWSPFYIAFNIAETGGAPPLLFSRSLLGVGI